MLFRQKVNLEKISTGTIIINNAWKGILKAIRMLKLPAKYLCIPIMLYACWTEIINLAFDIWYCNCALTRLTRLSWYIVLFKGRSILLIQTELEFILILTPQASNSKYSKRNLIDIRCHLFDAWYRVYWAQFYSIYIY